MSRIHLRKALLSEFPSASNLSEVTSRRRFATYENETVLIDPKIYGEDPNDALGIKVWDRVQDLAATLGPFHNSDYLTLRCKGFFEDEVHRQFYFVYELPSGCGQPLTSTPPPSLLQYVSSSFKPSMTQRFQLAYRLALSVQKLHENGLLHKGVRSENVLFFLDRWSGQRSLANPRLVGFDFARREGPEEYSEKPMSAPINYPLPDL
jgi:hypothetical protein